MIGQLRLYLPTGSGITSATIVNTGTGETVASGITPLGTGTYAWSGTNLTPPLAIFIAAESGWSISRWVINEDGTVQYVDGGGSLYLLIDASTSVNDLQIRVEMGGGTLTTYYAYLTFDANGGTGAPATVYGSSIDGTGYVTMAIPDEAPTRSGYVFAGWATNAAGTGTIRQPGGTYTGYGSTTSPGTAHTLYAVWTAATGTGGAYIGNGSGFGHYAPYVWTGSAFVRAAPYVWSDAWRKGT